MEQGVSVWESWYVQEREMVLVKEGFGFAVRMLVLVPLFPCSCSVCWLAAISQQSSWSKKQNFVNETKHE